VGESEDCTFVPSPDCAASGAAGAFRWNCVRQKKTKKGLTIDFGLEYTICGIKYILSRLRDRKETK
jgi:hypothetical protein